MISKDEAIKIAKGCAIQEGWPWKGKVYASIFRKWLLIGEAYWKVISNSENRGQNVHIIVKGSTGKVVKKRFFYR